VIAVPACARGAQGASVARDRGTIPYKQRCSDTHLRGGAGAARATEDTVQRVDPHHPVKQKWRLVRNLLGPGLITGAADDDPSGIATYSQAGAQFGYGLLWTVFLTTPFMIAIQLVSAHIGRVTGKGIIANVREIAPRWLVLTLLALLLAANIFNIAADFAAMGEALALVIGGLTHEHALIFAATSVLLQVFVPYHRYAPVLKWMTLVLFLYVVTAFTVKIPWGEALAAMAIPRPRLDRDYLLMVVAVLGTTISPYLFFWQASQEVEEMARGRPSRPLKELSGRQQHPALRRITLDTTIGMVLSNLIAFFIVVTTASVLHAAGKTEIATAADAANALRPLAGDLTFGLFALGIVGTGLLAVPVLAGSAAYGVAEAFGWPATLEASAPKAPGFYAIIAAATVIGFALGFAPINPIRMLVFSAVANGIVAVPVMAAMMIVVTRTSAMGRYRARPLLIWLGWTATALMALTDLALIWSALA
jgi:NRAMP (natural resistance-associated macrophage protein)-like metal ion transporter